MDDFSTSRERSLADLVLFALGFTCFLVLASGLVLAVPSMVVVGVGASLVVILCFWIKAVFGT
jgi:hypothetical protein